MVEMARHITERDWQQQVNDLLRYYNWYSFHAFDSRRSSPGWPDTVAISEHGKLIERLGRW